jgi:hypothetical protein
LRNKIDPMPLIIPFLFQNTVAITLQMSWTSLASGSRFYPLPTRSFIRCLIMMNLSFILSCLDLKRFNEALHTNALVAICSSLRDLEEEGHIPLHLSVGRSVDQTMSAQYLENRYDISYVGWWWVEEDSYWF